MKKLFYLSIFFFLAISGWAQNIDISGQVVDKETQGPVPFVHVFNQSKGTGTTTNNAGRFSITIDKADTIVFSSIGFESLAFNIKDEVTSDKLVLTIEINSSTMELQPVKVFAYRNEHALKQAILDMDVPIQPKEKPLEIPGVKMSRSMQGNGQGGVTFGGPLTALANVFSKAHKEQKKLKVYKQEYEYQKIIKAKYNEAVVMRLTNLPEDKIADFMEFCNVEDSFIHRATEYEIAVVVNQCLTDFKQHENKIKD